jgi:hypothetical protein
MTFETGQEGVIRRACSAVQVKCEENWCCSAQPPGEMIVVGSRPQAAVARAAHEHIGCKGASANQRSAIRPVSMMLSFAVSPVSMNAAAEKAMGRT